MIMSEKNCYTKDEIMLMIANTFVVYVYHIENNGLVDGKTGAMLFLYRYAALSGNEDYEALAGQLLDGMMKVAPSLPHGFESGLAGVGWAISRLIREGLVGGHRTMCLELSTKEYWDVWSATEDRYSVRLCIWLNGCEILHLNMVWNVMQDACSTLFKVSLHAQKNAPRYIILIRLCIFCLV